MLSNGKKGKKFVEMGKLNRNVGSFNSTFLFAIAV